ncbi:hypothetical protein QBC46DRAFT_233136, partial [Diplogelasinospora grovesii]
MCYHGRVLYICNHSSWGNVVRQCEAEQEFERGEIDQGCSRMWPHAYKTVRVQTDCKPCIEKKAQMDAKLSEVKTRMKAIKK